MKFKDVKVGEKYRVVKNRTSLYGVCGDIVAIEGQEVKILKIQHKDEFAIESKNGEHVCKAENLEPINKRNEVYIYEALPYKVNWKVTHNGEVTYETTDSEEFIYKLILNGDATIFILNNEFKGVAKCLPTDTYDVEKGTEIAYLKTLIKSYEKKLKELSK